MTDSSDLMRTLTTDEERVIQELVQVSVCGHTVPNYIVLYQSRNLSYNSNALLN